MLFFLFSSTCLILLTVVDSSSLHDPCLFKGVTVCLLDSYLTVKEGGTPGRGVGVFMYRSSVALPRI
jgi:hypothetical protein